MKQFLSPSVVASGTGQFQAPYVLVAGVPGAQAGQIEFLGLAKCSRDES